ncbi:MAG TPA: M48 family metalloprotease [Gemmatimonadales bacterium]|jgi:predicted Zn-dependent protease|nr:M48 family metalloprotease [Gemmatimonadales bacterium]
MRRGRFVIAAIIAVISLITYFASSSDNPITGESQHVGNITHEQEVALGLQAAPEMAAQFGGISSDAQATQLVNDVCARLVSRSDAQQAAEYYRFECHLLADPSTINAFALPGGQVFITEGLLSKLTTEAQLGGVLGHEIGHVVARHSAEQMAKAQLTQGLTGAAVLATYDPNDPSTQRTAAVAAMIGQLVSMKFSRSDELEADRLGVKLESEAGYDPRAMVEVMKVLEAEAGGSRQPEFFSTHPNPENRIPRIEEAIRAQFPDGVPSGLTP